jgi:hypothetical protein
MNQQVVNTCAYCGKPVQPVAWVNTKPVVTHMACAMKATEKVRNEVSGKNR